MAHSYRPSTLGIAMALTSLFAPLFASAQVVAFTTAPRPTITRAIDIVQEPPASVKLGTRLAFKRKSSGSANSIHLGGFQIRIFVLGQGERRPRPVARIDDCDIYVTTVHKIHGSLSADILVDQMDERWLALSHSGNSVLNGRYYFVFENTSTEDDVFRLHKDDSEPYFDAGFELIVDGASGANLERVRQAYSIRERNAAVLYAEIDKRGSKIPCYRYVRHARDHDPQLVAEGYLGHCAPA